MTINFVVLELHMGERELEGGLPKGLQLHVVCGMQFILQSK